METTYSRSDALCRKASQLVKILSSGQGPIDAYQAHDLLKDMEHEQTRLALCIGINQELIHFVGSGPQDQEESQEVADHANAVSFNALNQAVHPRLHGRLTALDRCRRSLAAVVYAAQGLDLLPINPVAAMEAFKTSLEARPDQPDLLQAIREWIGQTDPG